MICSADHSPFWMTTLVGRYPKWFRHGSFSAWTSQDSTLPAWSPPACNLLQLHCHATACALSDHPYTQVFKVFVFKPSPMSLLLSTWSSLLCMALPQLCMWPSCSPGFGNRDQSVLQPAAASNATTNNSSFSIQSPLLNSPWLPVQVLVCCCDHSTALHVVCY